MKYKKQDLDAIIDDAACAVRNEQLDDSIVDQAATRVWARVSRENSASAETGPAHSAADLDGPAGRIDGCPDFQSLIPAYLDKKLSTARALLLEDHTTECIPCRRALKTARTNRAGKKDTFVVRPAARRPATERGPAARPGWSGSKFLRRGIAAALIVGLGLTGLFMFERLDWSGRTLAATLENSNGAVYVVSDSQESRLLAPGEKLLKGERVRTAKDASAVLRLADGSTVEMRERSEFSVSENRRGVTLKLDRGDVIVEAAKQDRGRLYVQTPDSLVSVKGTIFAVESGTKGSRVSVVEGEVKVDSAGRNETLQPGDQTTTNPSLAKTSVAETVAWSRSAGRYANLVSELAKLRRDVNERVQLPGVRYSSKLVDLVPENTVFYAALPNLSESLAESERVMQERISQNPALAEWWKNNRSGSPLNEQTLTRVREFGSYLGDEIVVSAEIDARGEPNGVLVLGEVRDAAGFRSYLDGQLAAAANEAGNDLRLRIVDDPRKAAPSPTADGAKKSEMVVWIHDDIFAAANGIERLRTLAETLAAPGTNRFSQTSFHQRISDIYRDGAGIVVAADLEKIIGFAVSREKEPPAERRVAGLARLGVTSLRHFVVEQKAVDGKTLSRAALTFGEPKTGLATWLAAPGPMGALDFVSPNANVATAFVVKDPALLVDDLLGFLETVDPDMRRRLEALEKSQGLDLRNDFAAPLGGEFAFAIDGPILPTPSWKVVLEVYDQARLQSALERAIEKLNQFSVLSGRGRLSLESVKSGDRVFYTVKSAAAGLEVNYTYANGYLVAAPSRALLEQSIANRDAGSTLVRSPRFMSALPQDGNTNFSAIFYHDLAPLIGSLAERMKAAGGEELTEEQRQSLASIDANAPPTLVYAYAEGDRLTLAANTEGGAFGLSPASLIGLPNSFEMEHILMNALGGKNAGQK